MIKKCLNRADIAESTWLSYFNRYLFEKGMISEQERNKMKVLIASKTRGKKTA